MKIEKNSLEDIRLKSIQHKISDITGKQITKKETLSLLIYNYDKDLKTLVTALSSLRN